MRRVIEPTLTAALLVAALCACGLGGSKVSECNKLIDVMNKGAEQVRKAKAAGDSDVADLEKMATSMDDLAGNITRLKLTNSEVRKRADAYANNARDMARASRDMAAAARAKDRGRTATAKAAIDRTVAAEQPIVNDINTYCKAP